MKTMLDYRKKVFKPLIDKYFDNTITLTLYIPAATMNRQKNYILPDL